jgi:hypothetical protein
MRKINHTPAITVLAVLTLLVVLDGCQNRSTRATESATAPQNIWTTAFARSCGLIKVIA